MDLVDVLSEAASLIYYCVKGGAPPSPLSEGVFGPIFDFFSVFYFSFLSTTYGYT